MWLNNLASDDWYVSRNKLERRDTPLGLGLGLLHLLSSDYFRVIGLKKNAGWKIVRLVAAMTTMLWSTSVTGVRRGIFRRLTGRHR